MINMLRALKEKVDNRQEQMNNVNRYRHCKQKPKESLQKKIKMNENFLHWAYQ